MSTKYYCGGSNKNICFKNKYLFMNGFQWDLLRKGIITLRELAKATQIFFFFCLFYFVNKSLIFYIFLQHVL